MAKTNPDLWRSLATLLKYPTKEIAEDARQYRLVLRRALQEENEAATGEFAAFVESTTLGAIEEAYTATFDLSPECCPYVGYQLFGDDPKRNDLMVRLQGSYRNAGFDAGIELPDHVAVMLGFLAAGSGNEELERDLLSDLLAPALEKMSQSISDKNPYSVLLKSALSLVTASKDPLPDGEGDASLPTGGMDV